MSYRLSSKKRQQSKNRWLKFFLTIFFIALGFGIFSLLGGTFTSLSSSFVQGVGSTTDSVKAVGSDKVELIAENERLQQLLNQQTLDRALQNTIVERNNSLLQELGRASSSEKIAAGVIKKPPFTPYDIYTLDAGRVDGVEEGDLVTYSDFVTLGIITRTTDSGAKADLFSSPGKVTEVILNENFLSATGQGNGVLRIDVPRDFVAEVGDSVILPGYELYVVGTVAEIVGNPQDSFAQVMVRVPVNIQAVSIVSIVPYTKVNETTELFIAE